MQRRALLVALAVVGVSLVPYLVGWAVQTEDQVFGGFVIDLDDSNSYLAVMQQGMAGKWRFVSLYTPERQRGVWMYTFYTLLGHLVRWTRLSPLAVYHGARVACGTLLLVSVYRFSSLCFRRKAVIWSGFLLVAVSSGLGWLKEMVWPTRAGGISPLDFWFLDAYTFLGILTFPHFALAWTALLAALGSVLEFYASQRPGYLLAGGGAAFLTTAVHPTLSLVMGTVLAAYGLLLWVADRQFPLRWAIGGMPVVLAAGATAGCLWLAFQADPVLASWGQSIMATPALQHFLSGYGLLVPLALVGAVGLLRRRNGRGAFLVVWVSMAFLLAYTPFNLQRRFLEGVHIPISLLAAVGLRSLSLGLAQSQLVRTIARLGYSRRRSIWLAQSLVIAVTSLSNLYIVGSASVTAWARPSSLFHSSAQLAAFDWLNEHLTEQDVVLASYDTGNLIPAWTGKRVLLGHWAESVNWEERERLVVAFFDVATADGWRVELLRRYGISYIFFGERERALGDFYPGSAAFLREVYSVGEATIFETRLAGDG
jgi:hypothetical protein